MVEPAEFQFRMVLRSIEHQHNAIGDGEVLRRCGYKGDRLSEMRARHGLCDGLFQILLGGVERVACDIDEDSATSRGVVQDRWRVGAI